MSLNYTSYVNELATLVPTTTNDANFLSILPGTIDYAEERIYRELDLLSNVVRDTSATLTANSRDFTLPQSLGRVEIVNGLNVFTPSGSTTKRNPLIPVSRDFLDMCWPSSTTGNTLPQYFAMITDQTLIVGPPPDASYTVEVVGIIQPAPLSASNPTTFLTLYLPDLMIAASMVFLSGYKQNFSASGDNPAEAVNWEKQYQTLFASADEQENRKRFMGSAWSSLTQAPIAAPPRN